MFSNNATQLSSLHRGPRRSRAFTLIDVLVSMSVIAVLIGILLPSLATVHETARRTVCSSNLRQIGLGVASFADERGGRIPGSVFKPDSQGGGDTQEMMVLRLANSNSPQWDGLGHLHRLGYLLGPKVYYCPSHHGENPFSEYALQWTDQARTRLVGNYQYRGSSRDGIRDFFRITPTRAALVSDGMRTKRDYNHVVGTNVLRVDLSTTWVDDRTNSGVSSLYVSARGEDQPMMSETMDEAWRRLDDALPTTAR